MAFAAFVKYSAAVLSRDGVGVGVAGLGGAAVGSDGVGACGAGAPIGTGIGDVLSASKDGRH